MSKKTLQKPKIPNIHHMIQNLIKHLDHKQKIWQHSKHANINLFHKHKNKFCNKDKAPKFI